MVNLKHILENIKLMISRFSYNIKRVIDHVSDYVSDINICKTIMSFLMVFMIGYIMLSMVEVSTNVLNVTDSTLTSSGLNDSNNLTTPSDLIFHTLQIQTTLLSSLSTVIIAVTSLLAMNLVLRLLQ
jgi:hypothetical protein